MLEIFGSHLSHFSLGGQGQIGQNMLKNATLIANNLLSILEVMIITKLRTKQVSAVENFSLKQLSRVSELA